MLNFADLKDDSKDKIYKFQCSTILNIKAELEKNSIKIFNQKMFLYFKDKTIKVYNILSLKQIFNKFLFFTPRAIDIINSNSVLLFDKNKLYYYKINLKEKKLNFKFYISDVFMFKYIPDKNEIFIIMTNSKGCARIDLSGKIIFNNYKKPKINYKFDKKYEKKYKYIKDGYNGNFYLNDFNKGNKLIYMYIKEDVDSDYVWEAGRVLNILRRKVNISIINYENLALIYNKENKKLSENWDITYSYGKFERKDIILSKFYDIYFYTRKNYIFYYNEKNNQIEFANYTDDPFNERKFIGINNDKFIIYTNKTIYLVNISGIINKKKIILDEKYVKYYKNKTDYILYSEINNCEYLILVFTKDGMTKIIIGVIQNL